MKRRKGTLKIFKGESPWARSQNFWDQNQLKTFRPSHSEPDYDFAMRKTCVSSLNKILENKKGEGR